METFNLRRVPPHPRPVPEGNMPGYSSVSVPAPVDHTQMSRAAALFAWGRPATTGFTPSGGMTVTSKTSAEPPPSTDRAPLPSRPQTQVHKDPAVVLVPTAGGAAKVPQLVRNDHPRVKLEAPRLPGPTTTVRASGPGRSFLKEDTRGAKRTRSTMLRATLVYESYRIAHAQTQI